MKCYFCKQIRAFTALVNYKWGPTGNRGSYRRRACTPCILDNVRNISGPWKGK
jgi:hypothetical protein